MKKLKQFYKNNEKTILVCTGIAIGSATTSYFVQHLLNGMELTSANLYSVTETGQKFLRVGLANGTVRDYLWQDTNVAV